MFGVVFVGLSGYLCVGGFYFGGVVFGIGLFIGVVYGRYVFLEDFLLVFYMVSEYFLVELVVFGDG